MKLFFFSHSSPVEAAVTRVCSSSSSATSAGSLMQGVGGDGQNWILIFSFQHFFWDRIRACPKTRMEVDIFVEKV